MRTIPRLLIYLCLAQTQILPGADRIAADEASAAYRSGNIDPQVLKVPARILAALSKASADGIRELAEFLTTGTNNDFGKVKRIHDWITESIAYDNDRFYGNDRPSDPLKERRATCGGFSALFLEMANHAGIKAVTITGRSRSTFDSKTNAMASHVWNAVEIGGKWYIVDTTHDSRFSYNKGAFGKKSAYRDTQLFISATAKIVENFPDEERYQFLPQPKSFAEFLAFPRVSMNFLRHGVAFLGGAPGGISKEKLPARGSRYFTVTDFLRPGAGTAILRLSAPPEVSLFGRVTSVNGKSHDAHALCYRSGNETECTFSAPGAGEYAAYISAREKPDEKLFTKVYEFTLSGTEGKGPGLPPANTLVLFDALHEYAVKIVNHNLSDAAAQEYFLEAEFPATAEVFSTLWDNNDQKINGSSKASKPEASGSTLRVRYTYKPPASGIFFVKLRVKPAGAKLYNDTAAIVRIVR